MTCAETRVAAAKTSKNAKIPKAGGCSDALEKELQSIACEISITMGPLAKFLSFSGTNAIEVELSDRRVAFWTKRLTIASHAPMFIEASL